MDPRCIRRPPAAILLPRGRKSLDNCTSGFLLYSKHPLWFTHHAESIKVTLLMESPIPAGAQDHPVGKLWGGPWGPLLSVAKVCRGSGRSRRGKTDSRHWGGSRSHTSCAGEGRRQKVSFYLSLLSASFILRAAKRQ